MKGNFKSLAEVYKYLQDIKKSDKKNNFKDDYTVEVQTDTTNYTGFKLKKYKNKLKLI